MPTKTPVARIWHGWTSVENADAYQAVVEHEVIPAILERSIPGLSSAQVMRAHDVVDGEIEFTTIIWFDSLESVKGFMGEDYRQAHVPESARTVLNRFEADAKHFHLVGSFD